MDPEALPALIVLGDAPGPCGTRSVGMLLVANNKLQVIVD